MTTIVDCVMASYETDVLEVRDAELADTVDMRVIVHGDRSFRGGPAPAFTYDATAAKTPTFVVGVTMLYNDDPWVSEHHLRNQSLLVAEQLSPAGSWFIVADADEIPHPESVRRGTKTTGRLAVLPTDLRVWWMDWRAPNAWQLERQAMMGKFPQFARRGGAAGTRIQGNAPVMPHVGWHLSTLGDAVFAQRKLQTFSHAEYDAPGYTALERLASLKADRMDVLGRYDLEPTTDLPSCAVQFPHLRFS